LILLVEARARFELALIEEVSSIVPANSVVGIQISYSKAINYPRRCRITTWAYLISSLFLVEKFLNKQIRGIINEI
jgi:2,4-dienoyl-CoA reductase-like NADH-dependent reductase (Old Yellow Enzyme family)